MKELSLHILDIAQNSLSAGCTRLDLTAAEHGDELTLVIADDGRGMSREFLASVTDPFTTTRTTRKVGLGVPLFKMAAEMTGGEFSIDSQPGRGTRICASFGLGHVDRMPLGDMTGTVLSLIQLCPQVDFCYRVTRAGGSYEIDTREYRQVLGEIPLSEPQVLAFIRSQIEEEEQRITC